MTRGHRVAAVAVLALSAPLVLGACSNDSTNDTATADSSTTSTQTNVVVNTGPTVEVTEFSFTPSAETVGLGETVTWRNVGDSSHTVTPEKLADGSTPFESSRQIGPDQTFVQTFTAAGSYAYFCSIHPDRMSGTLTVSPA
jgi:plastocyanin